MKSTVILVSCLVILSAAGLARESAGAAVVELQGAGATFPLPLYHKLFEVYFRQTGVRVHYQGLGSGGGISQIIQKKIDFAGTDAVMSPQESKEAGAPVIHLPTYLGAVVIAYNLPGNPKLRFTPGVLTEIFLGNIRLWNDPKVVALNGQVNLPGMNIHVVHRSDLSGTTHIFSEYLTKTTPEWREKLGTGKSLNWPVGSGAKGNAGVAGSVKQVPGSIGYVELIYALGNDMTVGAIRNRSGQYIEATPESLSLAANVPLPEDMHISLTDTQAGNGYPIGGFTWLVLYQEQDYGGRTRERGEEVARLMRWIIRDGQKFAKPLHYAPLSAAALSKAEQLLGTLTYAGRPLAR